MSSKKFITGLGNYHKIGSGSTPGPGGTTNYNDLTNKPQINGQELVGNTDLNNTYYTKQDINNSFYTKSNMSTLFYNKDEVDTLVNNLQQFIEQKLTDEYYTKNVIDSKLTNITNQISQLRTNLTSLINEKTSAEEHYLKNKAQLKQGEYIQLTKDDANKTITIAQSLRPDPEAPTTGIVFKDDAANDYVILNINDVFDPTIQTISGTYAHLDESYSSPKTMFNPQNKIIVNADVPNLAKSNNSLGFFMGCAALNTPIDLSLAATNLLDPTQNWNTTGFNFLSNCVNFNSTITFNQKIEKIQQNFMDGCTNFNNQFIDLFTPSLKEISMNFMQNCYNFAQNLDFSNTSLNIGSSGYNKIVLINFMWNCNKMGNHSINLGSKGLDCFKKTGYPTNYIGDAHKSLATENETSPAYVNGINLICYNHTAEDFYNFTISDTEAEHYIAVFRKLISSPYKKILVNGVEVQ